MIFLEAQFSLLVRIKSAKCTIGGLISILIFMILFLYLLFLLHSFYQKTSVPLIVNNKFSNITDIEFNFKEILIEK